MAKYDKADLERRMKGAVEALKHDLSGLRTGRANTALLEPINVTVYGSSMPLASVATISAPEPRMLSVQVRDGMENLKSDENKKEISEDERKRSETELQKLTDEQIKAADAAASHKEQEILGK